MDYPAGNEELLCIHWNMAMQQHIANLLLEQHGVIAV